MDGRVYPARGYLLCCIERCGSNLLTGALRATGLAGRPSEYFNPVLEGEGWRHELRDGVESATAFDRVLLAGTTPNGVFGAKLHFNHLRHLGLRIIGEWSEEQRLRSLNLLRELQANRPALVPEAQAMESLRKLEPDLQEDLRRPGAV